MYSLADNNYTIERKKMNNYNNKAWRQYEAGKAYKNRIGFYERARENEAFYRGEQWKSSEGRGLSKPIFNLVRRIIDYLVCSICGSDISVRITDDSLAFATEEQRAASEAICDTLTKNTAYRWEKCNMDSKLHKVLTDAAISGDGAFFCYWDPREAGASGFEGDIVTDIIDSACIFPADVNHADIQSQEYIIISGRASVASLRAEAAAAGASDEDIMKILPDDDTSYTAGRMSDYELEDVDESEKKATYIVKLYRQDGIVCFEKSVKECIIKRACTGCKLYPVAYFNWTPTKNSFHGTSPVTGMIANQKFVNRAYAMAMKHMTDTAFSKVIYDKSKIPEWSNEVGEAIAAMGGGNIADAVSVVGTGNMQSGFMDFVDSAVTLTKELMGATESALGNLEAKNTSAILALQETSRVTLDNIRYSLYKAIEDLADIWVDMLCAYYPAERLLACTDGEREYARGVDREAIRKCMLTARVDVTEVTRYSALNAQNMLDRLLDGGHITALEYVKRLPSGLVSGSEELISELEKRENLRKETECG